MRWARGELCSTRTQTQPREMHRYICAYVGHFTLYAVHAGRIVHTRLEDAKSWSAPQSRCMQGGKISNRVGLKLISRDAAGFIVVNF